MTVNQRLTQILPLTVLSLFSPCALTGSAELVSRIGARIPNWCPNWSPQLASRIGLPSIHISAVGGHFASVSSYVFEAQFSSSPARWFCRSAFPGEAGGSVRVNQVCMSRAQPSIETKESPGSEKCRDNDPSAWTPNSK